MIPEIAHAGHYYDDYDGIALVAMLTAERLVRGHITATDAAIEIVQATKPVRDAARNAATGCEART